MRIHKLDGLRGIFSVMIIFFHYDILIPAAFSENFIIRESNLFVDFFFVLSGFVIALNYNAINTFKKLGTYMKKRLIRLYPLLFFTVTMIFAVDLFHYYFTIGKENIAHLIEKLIDSIFMMNSTPLLGNTNGVNHPSWSISAEMISYLLFGLISLIALGTKRMWLCIVVVLGSSVAMYLAYFYDYRGDLSFLKGIYGFNLGVLVWYGSNKKLKINKVVELGLPVVLIVLLYVIHQLTGLDKVLFKNIIGIFFALVIFTLIQTDGLITRFLESRFIQFLGLVSFSIYLNHLIVIKLVPSALFRFIPQNAFSQYFVLLLCVGVIFLYSHFTHKYIELGVGRRLKNKLN